MLVIFSSRKWHIDFCLVPKVVILNNLEPHIRVVQHWAAILATVEVLLVERLNGSCVNCTTRFRVYRQVLYQWVYRLQWWLHIQLQWYATAVLVIFDMHYLSVDHAVVHVRRGSTTLQMALHSASERNGTGPPIVVTGSRRDGPLLSTRSNEWTAGDAVNVNVDLHNA